MLSLASCCVRCLTVCTAAEVPAFSPFLISWVLSSRSSPCCSSSTATCVKMITFSTMSKAAVKTCHFTSTDYSQIKAGQESVRIETWENYSLTFREIHTTLLSCLVWLVGQANNDFQQKRVRFCTLPALPKTTNRQSYRMADEDRREFSSWCTAYFLRSLRSCLKWKQRRANSELIVMS